MPTVVFTKKLTARIPSRERIETLRRLALFVGEDTDDGEFLTEMAELLADIRVLVRGGRRDLKGSRHWDMEG